MLSASRPTSVSGAPTVAPTEADPSEWDETPEAAEPELRTVQVPAALHGQRLDRVLAELASEFSRSYLQQLIAARAVQVDARLVIKPAQAVRAGNTLTVELRPTLQSQAFRPQALALSVVYEDADLLVIDKPAGLVVHPAPGHWSGTLLNGLLARDPVFAQLPRAGIVHRLDKDTSGLMVVARTRMAMDALVKAIAAREVQRQYCALAHRPWRGSLTRTVEAPIGRDPAQRLRMAVVDLARQPGKTARTDFECLDSTDAACLVRCRLHTGRTHQIRVHLASLGHPLMGDSLYGGSAAAGLLRQGLHAERLALRHPVRGHDLCWTVPLPADLAHAAQQLALRYNPPLCP